VKIIKWKLSDNIATGVLLLLFLACAVPTVGKAEGISDGDVCTTQWAYQEKNESTGYYFLICNGTNWKQAMSVETLSGQATPVMKVQTEKSGVADALVVYNAASGYSGAGIRMGISGLTALARIIAERSPTDSNSSSLQFYTRLATTTAERMRISTNGYVGIGTTSPQAALDVVGDIYFTGSVVDVSDRRVKSDITLLSNQLEKVAQLRPVSFVMKDDPKQRVELGLIAQDVEPIFPELVGDSGGMKSMNYLGLIAPLVGAVQELEAENAALRRNFQELSQRMNVLEGKIRPPLTPYNH
jgi:hypothetical protein